MKLYKITLLTARGSVTENYTTNQDLKDFEAEMFNKHGQFIMLKAEEII